MSHETLLGVRYSIANMASYRCLTLKQKCRNWQLLKTGLQNMTHLVSGQSGLVGFQIENNVGKAFFANGMDLGGYANGFVKTCKLENLKYFQSKT